MGRGLHNQSIVGVPTGPYGWTSATLRGGHSSSLHHIPKIFLNQPNLLELEAPIKIYEGANKCPAGGVGNCNPGFRGMNIEQGKTNKTVLYMRYAGSINVIVSLTSAADVSNWTKKDVGGRRN